MSVLIATLMFPKCLNKQQGKQNNAILDWFQTSQSLEIVLPFGKVFVNMLSRNVYVLVSCAKENGFLGGSLWTINSFSTYFQVAGH